MPSIITGSDILTPQINVDDSTIKFRKDGSDLGSIDTFSEDVYIASGNVGLRFRDAAADTVNPCDNGGNLKDDAIDLGQPEGRFKDLFLSGGVGNPSGSVSVTGERNLNLQGAFYAQGGFSVSSSETRVTPLFNLPSNGRMFVGTIKLLSVRAGFNQTASYVEHFMSGGEFDGSFRGFIDESARRTSNMSTLKVDIRNDQLVIEARASTTAIGTFSFIIEGNAYVPFIYDGSFYTV